jgi:hypothetical protein
VSKQLIAQLTQTAKECVSEQKAAASNDTIRRKLDDLSSICERLATVEGEKPLTIVEVAKRHKDLSEQTIRNNRPNGNPYMTVFRAWGRVADVVSAAARPPGRSGVHILSESSLHTIKDHFLRHQVIQVFAQNRSLHNSVNTLRKLQGEREIRLNDGPELIAAPGEGLVLTSAEVAAIRDFINPRKLKAKQLKPSKDDAVHTVDDHPIADPGFLSALRKISKSYERPE